MIVNHLKGKNTTQLTKSCQCHYKTSLLISISGSLRSNSLRYRRN